MFEQMPAHLALLAWKAETCFLGLPSDYWFASLGEGKWTRLELLGHLIDSASNNHQRFVRALLEPRLDWPGYAQMGHVVSQNYRSADPILCITLWASYNRHLAFVIAQIPKQKATTPCSIDGAPDRKLSDLVLDYVAHLEHHLKQLLPVTEVQYSGMPWPPVDPNRHWPV